MSASSSMPTPRPARRHATRAAGDRPGATSASGRARSADDRRAPGLATGFASPAEATRCLRWLGEGLRPGRPERLAREFPLLLSPEALSAGIAGAQDVGAVVPSILSVEGRPVAFSLLWQVRFRLGAGSLRAGLISFVYTDPAERGRGHAVRVVAASVERARARGLGVVMLWSDLDRLYGGLGFTRAGREAILPVDASVLETASRERPWRGDPAGPDTPVAADWLAIERLREERPCRLELPPGTLARMASIPDLEVRVARRAGVVRGFAMLGRGDDFPGVVHEWGGEPDAVLACLRALAARRAPESDLMLLGSGSDDDPVAFALRRCGARVLKQPMAWMRIADPEGLSRDLRDLLGHPFRIRRSPGPIDVAAPALSLEHGADGARTLSEAALVQALFGAPPGIPAAPDLAAACDALAIGAVDSRLPLPLFVRGLESI